MRQLKSLATAVRAQTRAPEGTISSASSSATFGPQRTRVDQSRVAVALGNRNHDAQFLATLLINVNSVGR